MRLLFSVFLLIFALPAFAQQDRACRGKQPINLGGGVSGCLLDLGKIEVTTTRTRDDGASSSTRGNTAGQIRVLLFGAYEGSKRVVGPRITAVCKAFLPQLKAELSGTKFHRVVVVLIWPRVANPGDFVPISTSKVAVQPAFSSAACRGVRYFK